MNVLGVGEYKDPWQPLLDDPHMELDIEEGFYPETEDQSNRSLWGGRIVSALASGGCLALRLCVQSKIAHGIGIIGTPFFAMSAISWGAKAQSAARIRQVSTSLFFGAGAAYTYTQFFYNTRPGNLNTFFAHAVIATLGGNIFSWGKWLADEGGLVRNETGAENVSGKRIKDYRWLRPRSARACKIAAAGGFLALHFLSSGVISGLSAYVASYYCSQVSAEVQVDQLGKKIKKYDQEQDAVSQKRARYSRNLWTGITTAANVLLPFCFVPWVAKPTSEQTIKLLWATGIAYGFLRGWTNRTWERRVKEIPIQNLYEFKKMEQPDKQSQPYLYWAWKIYRTALPIVNTLGLTAFCTWQFIEKPKTADRIAIGTTWFVSLSVYLTSLMLDRKWNPEGSNSFLNKLMPMIWGSPRIFGFDGLAIFLGGTNVERISSHYLGSGSLTTNLVRFITWGGYSMELGRALYVDASERHGTWQTRAPTFATLLAITSGYLAAKNDSNVPSL